MTLEHVGMIGSIFFVGVGVLIGFIIWGMESEEDDAEDN